MDTRRGRPRVVCELLQRHFLWLLVCAYALAVVVPVVGSRLGSLCGEVRVLGCTVRASAPAALLGFLLFAAGLGVKGGHLRNVFRKPTALALGLTASVAVPVLLLVAIAPLLALWHDPGEATDLVVGLSVVAAMPVAGSSAAWSQSADGDCALSLGLVLVSTVLSPLTTPLALRTAGLFAPGGAGDLLGRLAGAGGASAFLAAWVVVPMAIGILTRWAAGGPRADAVGLRLKPLSSVVLLTLCYANASACLPGAAADPDWDFLTLVVVAVSMMSGAAFAAGFGVARAVRADKGRRASLVFGVGMANNGAGL